MPVALLALVLAETPLYPNALLAAFAETAPRHLRTLPPRLRPALKDGGVVVVEAEIDAAGSVVSERLAVSSGKNPLDDVARTLVLASEPFAVEPTSGAHTCLVRLAFAGKAKKPDVVVACLAGDNPVAEVAGELDAAATDAGAQLMRGWQSEAAGDDPTAAALYGKAVEAAPQWDLAARALGLSWVKAKTVPQAIPYLKIYVQARGGAPDAAALAREIERFEKTMAAREAEANRVRDRLSKAEIATGIRKGYPLLEPCLKAARAQSLLSVGVDTLVLTWKIRKDGTAYGVRIEGPTSIQMTEHADCLEQAVMRWRFPKYGEGSEVTATRVPLKVRGSPPPAPPASSASPAAAVATEALDEPMFAECERSADAIGAHVKSRFARLQACVTGERRRAPGVPMPDSLPISFVIDAEGPVRDVMVNHRAYREGPLAACLAEALAVSFPAAGGADCPAEFAVDLRGFHAERRP